MREIAFRTLRAECGRPETRRRRAGRISLADEPLMGDIILDLWGTGVNQPAGAKGRDFVKLLNMPVGQRSLSCAAGRRTPFFCTVLMVALMLTDEIPNRRGDYRLPADGKGLRCIDAGI